MNNNISNASNVDLDIPELGAEFDVDNTPNSNQKPTVFDLNKVGDTQGIPNVSDAKKSNAAAKGAALIFIAFGLVFGGFMVYKTIMKNKQQDAVASTANKKDNGNNTSSKVLALDPATAPPPLTPLPDAGTNPNGQVPITLNDPNAQNVPMTTAPMNTQTAPVTTGKKILTLAEKKFASSLVGTDKLGGALSGNEGGTQTATNASPFAPTPENAGNNSSGGGKLGGLLKPLSTGDRSASVIKDRNLTMAKGTFIECLLETRVDTTVPGMTSCVIPRDIYSENGKVLLVEKGSKVVGEYQGSVENGLNRIFVLWTRIKTPNGVLIGLDSPSTDFLGGAGMTGKINNHWFKRFGSALMFSMVQDGFSYLANKGVSNNGGVIYQNSQESADKIIEEAMKATGNIPPTLTKNQGERIGIFVGRDLYFGDVYALKAR